MAECGTKGSPCVSENGYHLKPTRPGQLQQWRPAFEEESYEVVGEAAFGDLKTKEDTTQEPDRQVHRMRADRRQPHCSLEDAHRSTTFAHLANISLQLKRRIKWDAASERITNLPAANDLLHYTYREPRSLD